jgi:hypothetical protein
LYEENPSMRQVYQITNQPHGSKCLHAEGFHRFVPCLADELPPCFTSPGFPKQWAAEVKKEKVSGDELAAARKKMATWEKKGIIGNSSLPAKLARETKRVDERGYALQKAQQKEQDVEGGELEMEKKLKVLEKEDKVKDQLLKESARQKIVIEQEEESMKRNMTVAKKRMIKQQQILEREAHDAVIAKAIDDRKVVKMQASVKSHMSVIKNQAKRTAYWRNKYSASTSNVVDYRALNDTIKADHLKILKDRQIARMSQMKLHAISQKYEKEEHTDAGDKEKVAKQRQQDNIQIQKLQAELQAPAFLARKEALEKAKQALLVQSIRAHGAKDVGREEDVAKQFAGQHASIPAAEPTSPPISMPPTPHTHSRLKHQVGCTASTTWNLSPDTHQCEATPNNAVGVMVGHYKKKSISGSIEQCQDACCSNSLCGGFKFISSGCSSSSDIACAAPGVCSFLVETLTLGAAPFKVGQGGGGCLVFSRSRGR